MTCHREVHQVRITQVNLRDTPCPFHHNGIIPFSQTVKGGTYLIAEIDVRITAPPIIVGILIADGFAVQDNLRRMVTLRFEQQRVHIRMTRNTCRLSLHGLGSSDLQSFRGGV